MSLGMKNDLENLPDKGRRAPCPERMQGRSPLINAREQEDATHADAVKHDLDLEGDVKSVNEARETLTKYRRGRSSAQEA